MNRKDGVARYNDDLTAAFIVETERWDLADKYFTPSAGAAGAEMAGHAGHNAPSTPPAAASSTTPRPSSAKPIDFQFYSRTRRGKDRFTRRGPIHCRAASGAKTNLRKG